MEKQRFKNSRYKLRVRLGSVALVLIMLLSLFPVTALAATPTGLWVAGTEITAAGCWLNDGSGGITATGASESNYNVKYDGSGTLTLNGAQLSPTTPVGEGADAAYIGIYSSAPLTLTLEGENSVGAATETTLDMGALSAGALTVNGTGSLSVTLDAAQTVGLAAGSALTVTDATVTIDSGTNATIGLVATSGDLSITNADITVNGGWYGLYASAVSGTVSIGGTSVVNVTSSIEEGYGILAGYGNIAVSGAASVTATATGATGCGAFANGDITIADTAQVIASATGTGSCGIAAVNNISITGTAKLTASGTTFAVVVQNGKLTVNGVAQDVDDKTTITVEGSQPPADDGVNTEAELVAAVEQGGDIKLTGDIDLTEVLIIDKSVDLDLNGYTIRQTGSTAMEWCDWYGCPASMCRWNSGNDPHSEKAISDAIHVVGGQTEKVAVNIRDTRTTQTGKVIAGDGADYAVTIYGDNLDLRIYGGTFSGGSTFCVYNSYRWTSPSWITLYGGTYENGVQVNTIRDGTFKAEEGKTGDTWVCAYDIYDGICEAGTEAQMTEFYGGTFNGAAECFGIVEGGVFNGHLHLSRGVSSVSDCTINHSLEWSGDTMPTFTNVTVAEDIKLWNRGYEVVNGQIQMIPRYTVLVTTADSDMGTLSSVRGSVTNPESATGIIPTTLTGGGRQWEDAYRNAAVNITGATAEAKDGYTFVGWYDNAQGTGTALSTNATLTYQSDEYGLQSNLSFYAVFESDETYADKVAAANAWLGNDYDNTDTFTINNIGDMESFTIAVNYLGKNFSGKTVKLADDLTYTDADSFTPIGNSGIAFQGIFDGQNHSISGLRYSTTNQSSAYVGLFGNVNGAEIKNLTLSGVNFSGGWMTGAFAGHADNTAFTNCKLTGNSSLADAYFLGGIFGHGAASNTVSGCTVENSTIDGYWKTGGVSGYICGATVTDTKIKDTTFPGTGFNGALIGHANDGKTEMTNVTVSGVTDGSQQKIHVVGTNYASGKDHTITITGGSTYVDAAGILQSALGDNNVAVSGGSYTFAIPVDQIDTGKVSVTFKNGEKIVIVQVIATGGTVTPPTMSDDGASIFDGWYLEDGVTRITSSTTFSANTVATPKWTELAITLSQSSLSIVQGGTATLTATVTPATAPDKTVTWSTSDSAIATIDNGTVIAVAPGTATITAAVDGKSASCTVTVTAAGMVIPAVEEPKTDTDQISDSADKQTASDVAKTVAADETITSAAQSAATELNNSSEKSDLIEKGNQDLNPSEGKEVTLYTQTYLQIEATELSKDEENSAITSITLNITPMMQVVASTATNSADIKLDSGAETNAVVVQNPKPLTIRTESEITVKLPASFGEETVYIKHVASSGTYFYSAETEGDGTLTFTSTHGFSPFTFSLINDAVAEVNSVGYASFQEAVNAAANGDTVEIWKNESLTATVSGSSRTITVKNSTGNEITVTLNGQTMTIAQGETKDYTYTRPTGGGGGVSTYAITTPSDVEHGTIKVSPTRASSGTKVTITVTPDEGYQLDKLTATDGSGKAVALTCVSDTEYTFKMPASKVEIAASFSEITQSNSFTDVYESDYYYEAVLWAVENGVTNGTTATTFSPNVTVTRAQMVTFLWRAYGSPEATGENPFTDVSESEYYYDAVLWAVENGITVGTTATTFSPEAPVTRAQAVTFQWRAAGSPAASGDSFNDVDANDYYADAVIWAVANGVTNGTGGNNFSPEVAVSRAQAVTFLYRELG